MTVRIEIHQDRTVEVGPAYKTKTYVLYAAGISRDIFVFNTETQAFSHVATSWDIENLPNTRQSALLDDVDYYRQSEAETSFEDVSTAEEFAAYTIARIEYLVSQYTTLSESFEGSDNHTFEA